MSNTVKKISLVLFVISLIVSTPYVLLAENNPSVTTNININPNEVSKHYDPYHPGHEHQCNSCRRTYHQPGDNGPYSSGTYRCPYCGYVNPVPPSPYPPQPPVPPYPYPPTPQPPQPWSNNVDELLRLHDRASDYRSADNIIVAGSYNVCSLKGLLRLAAKAYYVESVVAITANMNRPNIMIDASGEDIVSYLGKSSSYDKADILALTGAKRLLSVKGVFRVASRLYYRNSWQDLLDYCDANFGRYGDIPTVDDLKWYWGNATGYEQADRILLSGARYMRTMSDFVALENRAYYSSTKHAIEAMYIQHVGQNPPYPPAPHYNIQASQAVSEPLFSDDKNAKSKKISKSVSADVEAKIKNAIDELNNYNTEIGLEMKDIAELNKAKILEFVKKFKAGALKKSEQLYAIKDKLVERLKEACLTDQERAWRDAFNDLK